MILSVVPIFMSAGAAVLPTILGAAASVAAVALKPRELARLCRKHPGAVGASVLGIVAVAFVGRLLFAGAKVHAAPAAATTSARIDWSKVAEDILARQRLGKQPAMVSAPVESMSAALVLGHDFSRCSFAGGASPLKLDVLWSFRPEDTMFLSAPLVAGKRVFVAGCQSDLGSYTGLLACLDAETGKPLWQITQKGDDPLKPFFSSPALSADGKYLLIGQGLHQDHDCSLLCFDAADGRFCWAVKTSLHIESSPAILGDRVVVGAGAIEGPDGRATGDTGHVIAARISDGQELWREPVIDPESSPAIDEPGMAYIGSGFNGGAVVALRGETAQELAEKKLQRVAWKASLDVPVTCPITLAGPWVIAGASNGDVVHSSANAKGVVAALDRKTGEVHWRTEFPDGVLGAIAFRDDMLICPVRTGEVVALALADGKVLWRTRVSGNAPVIAGCAFTGKYVYAVSNDGYLAVLDAKDGKSLQRIYLNDQAKPGTGLTMSPPQVAGGRVFVGSETGGVRCLAGTEVVP